MLRHSYKSTAAATIAALTIALAAPTAATAEDTDALSDPALAACAREMLGLESTDPLTATDVASLDALLCYDDVASLDGLDAATSLTVLDIWPADAITDLTPLTGLTSLQYLGLEELGDVDLTPITTLTGLEALDLDSASIASLPDLSGVDALSEINISGTAITDLSPLAVVDTLTLLWAESTGITDLAPVANLTSLTDLWIAYSDVADLSPLEGHPSLESLDLYGNAISDISPLAALPALVDYDAGRQQIDGGEVARCELFPTPAAIAFNGATVTPFSLTAYRFGDQTLFSSTGKTTLSFYYDSRFSGTMTYASEAVSTGCAWPSSFSASVSVTGSVVQDSTLTASYAISGAPTNGDLSTHVYWYDDPTSSDPLTSGATFTTDLTNVGESFIAKLTISLPGMRTYVATSKTFGPILGTFPSGAKVKIDNTAVVGTQPTATLSGAGIGKSYDERTIWSLDGKVVYTSAWNGNVKYTLPASAKGKKLSVKVQVRADGYKTRTYQGPTTTVLGALGELTQVYPLQGTFKVGKTVTAKHPTYKSPAPTSYSYQWMRCGKKIAGATKRTYTITKADAGCKVYVKITAKRSGYASTTYTSERYKVPPLFTSAPTPKIVGTPVVGNLLKARVGTWSPTPTTLTYRWYRDGQAIAGATHKGYTLTKADAGHVITVKVTAKRSGYTTMTKRSAGVTARRS